MVGALAVLVMSVALVQAPTVQDRIDRAKAALDNLEVQTAADALMIAATDPRRRSTSASRPTSTRASPTGSSNATSTRA